MLITELDHNCLLSISQLLPYEDVFSLSLTSTYISSFFQYNRDKERFREFIMYDIQLGLDLWNVCQIVYRNRKFVESKKIDVSKLSEMCKNGKIRHLTVCSTWMHTNILEDLIKYITPLKNNKKMVEGLRFVGNRIGGVHWLHSEYRILPDSQHYPQLFCQLIEMTDCRFFYIENCHNLGVLIPEVRKLLRESYNVNGLLIKPREFIFRNTNTFLSIYNQSTIVRTDSKGDIYFICKDSGKLSLTANSRFKDEYFEDWIEHRRKPSKPFNSKDYSKDYTTTFQISINPELGENSKIIHCYQADSKNDPTSDISYVNTLLSGICPDCPSGKCHREVWLPKPVYYGEVPSLDQEANRMMAVHNMLYAFWRPQNYSIKKIVI